MRHPGPPHPSHPTPRTPPPTTTTTVLTTTPRASACSTQNVDFHLCAIKDLPRHLARYLPNVPYSGLLSGGDDSLHYTVLVTAATDLEVGRSRCRE